MIDLNDPDMKEIVIEFCDETDALIDEMKEVLDEIEEDPSKTILFEKYGQTVDRVMGAAQTMGLDDIGDLSKMGKIIGYKASQIEDLPLKEVTCGVLFDLCDFLEVLLNNLRTGNDKLVFNVKAFHGRLVWLSEKFKHIERSSCAFEEEAPPEADIRMSSSELEDLIKSLGDAA